jgi:hypothetical protein
VEQWKHAQEHVILAAHSASRATCPFVSSCHESGWLTSSTRQKFTCGSCGYALVPEWSTSSLSYAPAPVVPSVSQSPLASASQSSCSRCCLAWPSRQGHHHHPHTQRGLWFRDPPLLSPVRYSSASTELSSPIGLN